MTGSGFAVRTIELDLPGQRNVQAGQAAEQRAGEGVALRVPEPHRRDAVGDGVTDLARPLGRGGNGRIHVD